MSIKIERSILYCIDTYCLKKYQLTGINLCLPALDQDFNLQWPKEKCVDRKEVWFTCNKLPMQLTYDVLYSKHGSLLTMKRGASFKIFHYL